MALTTETFIEKARKVHGNKYDYSKVEYVNCRVKVCIVCPKHGEFWQVPYYHLNGNGCKKCFDEEKRGKTRQLTTEEFVKRARKVHGDKYDYSKVEYTDSQSKVSIICSKHGEFLIKPYKHLQNKGCPKCGIEKSANSRRLSVEEFVQKSREVHGNKYDYSNVEYTDSNTEVCIICPEHGEFWQTPHNHLNRCGCHKCNEWELENNIKRVLIENNIRFEQEKTFEWLKYENKLRLDFYLPDYNIAIECQGGQHFKSVQYFGGINAFKKRILRDKVKKELCEKNNIKILYYTNIKDAKTKYNCFGNENEIINEIKKS